MSRGLFLATLLLAVSCTPAAPLRERLAIAVLGEPTSVFADDPGARVIRGAVTETLVILDATDRAVARLAVAVPTVANGGLEVVYDEDTPAGRLVATFHLRTDAWWQDGRPVTGGDVRFAWEQDRSAAEGSDERLIAERIEGIEVVSARVVRVAYTAGERWDGYALAPRAMPAHLLADASPDERAAYEREPVHAGPYAIAERSARGLTLEPFDGYVLGRPSVGTIDVRFYQDRDDVLAALARGEVDVVPSPVLEADLVRVLERVAEGTDRTGLLAYYTPAVAVEVLRFGARLGDHALRRAVELALDRNAIVQTIFAGRARVPRTFLVPPGWAALDLGAAPPPDRLAARAYLLSSGYAPGTFGIMQRGGERLLVTILVAAGSSARSDAARIVAGQLAAIGIAADTRAVPPAELEGTIASGAYDLAVVPQPAHDPLLTTERYVGQAGAWFDALAAAARGAPDRTQRRELYAELQRLYLESVVAVPLYQHLAVDVAPLRLEGVRPTPHAAPLTWNVHEWRLSGGAP